MTEEELEAFGAMEDEDIDFSDIPELTAEDWKNARVVFPESKRSISIRVDNSVLNWFKSQGKGYQSRMNAVLRAYVEAHRERKK